MLSRTNTSLVADVNTFGFHKIPQSNGFVFGGGQQDLARWMHVEVDDASTNLEKKIVTQTHMVHKHTGIVPNSRELQTYVNYLDLTIMSEIWNDTCVLRGQRDNPILSSSKRKYFDHHFH